jgi:hypothetical protein
VLIITETELYIELCNLQNSEGDHPHIRKLSVFLRYCLQPSKQNYCYSLTATHLKTQQISSRILKSN